MCPENEVPPGGPPGDISEEELKKILGDDYAAVIGPGGLGGAADAEAGDAGAAQGAVAAGVANPANAAIGAEAAAADGRGNAAGMAGATDGRATGPAAPAADPSTVAGGAGPVAGGAPGTSAAQTRPPSDPSMSESEAEAWARRMEEQMEREARDAAASTLPPASRFADAGAPAAGPAVLGAAATLPGTPVQALHFAQIEDSGARATGSIDVLLDVKLPISVELGRTEMEVKEILQCAPGTVIELHKLAGEPVDVFINGRMVAQGEVVVVDEHFGVRVTSLLSPGERVRSLA